MTRRTSQPSVRSRVSHQNGPTGMRRHRMVLLATLAVLGTAGLAPSAYAAHTDEELELRHASQNQQQQQQASPPATPPTPAAAPPSAQSPKQLVTHGDARGPNYVGIQWTFGTETTFGSTGPVIHPNVGGGVGGVSSTLSPDDRVMMTVRENGKIVCQDQQEITNQLAPVLKNNMCGKENVIERPGLAPASTMRTRSQYPGQNEASVESLAHCHGKGLFDQACDHFWYVNY